MALISCPECGKEVSDRAPACIHCSYPSPPPHRMRTSAPITGPNRFTVRLTARPAYPDAAAERSAPSWRSWASRGQGIPICWNKRAGGQFPLREGLTGGGGPCTARGIPSGRRSRPVVVDGAVPEPAQLPSPVPGDALTFTSVVFATLTPWSSGLC